MSPSSIVSVSGSASVSGRVSAELSTVSLSVSDELSLYPVVFSSLIVSVSGSASVSDSVSA